MCKDLIHYGRWVLQLTDKKDNRHEFYGHKNCINELGKRVRKIDPKRKKSLSQIINELNLK